MKLKEIIENLDKDNPISVYGGDLEDEFPEINFWEIGKLDKLKEYPAAMWLCADTHVGATLLFFKDQFAAACNQQARKSDKEYIWVSKEMYYAVREYIISLIDYGKPEVMDDLEEQEMLEGVPVNYSCQVVNKELYFKPLNKLVKHVRRSWKDELNPKYWDTIDIELDGVLETVDVKDVLIPYRLRDDRKGLFYAY